MGRQDDSCGSSSSLARGGPAMHRGHRIRAQRARRTVPIDRRAASSRGVAAAAMQSVHRGRRRRPRPFCAPASLGHSRPAWDPRPTCWARRWIDDPGVRARGTSRRSIPSRHGAAASPGRDPHEPRPFPPGMGSSFDVLGEPLGSTIQVLGHAGQTAGPFRARMAPTTPGATPAPAIETSRRRQAATDCPDGSSAAWSSAA
jgi:hypothetical protein